MPLEDDHMTEGRMADKMAAIEEILEIAEQAGLNRHHRMGEDMNICLCL